MMLYLVVIEYLLDGGRAEGGSTQRCQDSQYVGYLGRIASGDLRGRYADGVGAGSNGAPGFRPDPCAADAND